MTDLKWAKEAIKGNDDAFLSLMLAHREALFRTALAYLKNEEDALEAVQEVTFRAYEKINRVRKPENIKTWLIRVTMNCCRDVLHKRKRLVFFVDAEGKEINFESVGISMFDEDGNVEISMKFPDEPFVNPIKLPLFGHPQWIEGDVKIQIK